MRSVPGIHPIQGLAGFLEAMKLSARLAVSIHLSRPNIEINLKVKAVSGEWTDAAHFIPRSDSDAPPMIHPSIHIHPSGRDFSSPSCRRRTAPRRAAPRGPEKKAYQYISASPFVQERRTNLRRTDISLGRIISLNQRGRGKIEAVQAESRG